MTTTSNQADARQTPVTFSGRILVADDSPTNLAVYRCQLTTLGLTVTTVENGRQALNEARQNDFDMIFLDLMMPEMDGLQTVQEIRKSDPHTPIIALSGHDTQEDREQSLAAGFSAHLGKSYCDDELIALLKEYLPESTQFPSSPAGTAPARALSPVDGLQEKFLENSRQQFESLRTSAATRDLAALSEAVHKLAGAAAVFQDTTVQAVTEQLTEAIETEDWILIGRLISRLGHTLEMADADGPESA